MVTGNSTSSSKVSKDEYVERMEIARQAACEIDGLARLVCREIDGNEDAAPLMSMLRRVSRLACISLSALDDSVETVPEIRARLEESDETAGKGADHG